MVRREVLECKPLSQAARAGDTGSVSSVRSLDVGGCSLATALTLTTVDSHRELAVEFAKQFPIASFALNALLICFFVICSSYDRLSACLQWGLPAQLEL
jgi:hypothetical protein